MKTLVSCLILAIGLTAEVPATTFTITNHADTGAGSPGQAVTDAMASTSPFRLTMGAARLNRTHYTRSAHH